MNCWKTLLISPTSDRVLIKAAYRSLIKKYHPDLVRTPEKIRANTIKCAQINRAYNEALVYAEKMGLNQLSEDYLSHTPKIDKKNKPTAVSILELAVPLIAIGSLVLIIMFGVHLTQSFDIVAVALRVAAGFFGFVIISTLICSQTVFVTLIVANVFFSRLIHEDYYYKILWLMVVFLNVMVAFTLIDFKLFDEKIVNQIFFAFVWNLWPIIMLVHWIRTVIKYNAIKDTSFLEET